MKASNIYLYFDGNCREAMTFYAACLGGKPCFTTYAEGPPDLAESAKSAPERVLHTELSSGPLVLMASDVPPGTPFQAGNNFSISISCESNEQLDRIFGEFAGNGKVTLALHDTFWGGRMGMVTDRFGVNWMLSYRQD